MNNRTANSLYSIKTNQFNITPTYINAFTHTQTFSHVNLYSKPNQIPKAPRVSLYNNVPNKQKIKKHKRYILTIQNPKSHIYTYTYTKKLTHTKNPITIRTSMEFIKSNMLQRNGGDTGKRCSRGRKKRQKKEKWSNNFDKFNLIRQKKNIPSEYVNLPYIYRIR